MLPETYTYIDGTHVRLQELERELKHQAVVKQAQEHQDGLLLRLGAWLNKQGERIEAPQETEDSQPVVQPSKLATDSGVHRIR